MAEVTVRSITGKAFQSEVLMGRHAALADEPRDAGGDDEGPGPYDLLLAALGSCKVMTVQMYARKKKWPLERVAVTLRHDRVHAKDCADCDSEEGTVDLIRAELKLDGLLDATQRARLVEIADRCPVHRTLTSEIKIVTREA